jgi:hypothetical protein
VARLYLSFSLPSGMFRLPFFFLLLVLLAVGVQAHDSDDWLPPPREVSHQLRERMARLMTRIKEDSPVEAFKESVELVKQYKEEMDPDVMSDWLEQNPWSAYLEKHDEKQRCADWGAEVIRSMQYDTLEEVIAEIYRCQVSVMQAIEEAAEYGAEGLMAADEVVAVV